MAVTAETDMNFLRSFVVFFTLFCMIAENDGSIYTQYAIHNPQPGDKLIKCASILGIQNACGGVIVNGECIPSSEYDCGKPYTGNWYTYLIRSAMKEVFEETRMSGCDRDLPFVLRTGSVIEVRYTLQPNWKTFGIDLNGDHKTILEAEMVVSGVNTLNTYDVKWGSQETCRFVNTVGVEAVLKIVCEADQFVIFFNGNRVCTYKYRAQPHLIREMSLYFTGGKSDLHQILYTV